MWKNFCPGGLINHWCLCWFSSHEVTKNSVWVPQKLAETLPDCRYFGAAVSDPGTEKLVPVTAQCLWGNSCRMIAFWFSQGEASCCWQCPGSSKGLWSPQMRSDLENCACLQTMRESLCCHFQTVSDAKASAVKERGQAGANETSADLLCSALCCARCIGQVWASWPLHFWDFAAVFAGRVDHIMKVVNFFLTPEIFLSVFIIRSCNCPNPLARVSCLWFWFTAPFKEQEGPC